ncbi:hypothetical protein B0H16DRAFT_1702501 [Mycena metata]|uniref:Uncharacterized protein n=1 Tax=Mycena metata TaxID=1033252 RepID=A0AAD7MEX7_9AGAR|nr:hypothetical protein B0H16DRAFT_1702501 [Mycena metata]
MPLTTNSHVATKSRLTHATRPLLHHPTSAASPVLLLRRLPVCHPKACGQACPQSLGLLAVVLRRLDLGLSDDEMTPLVRVFHITSTPMLIDNSLRKPRLFPARALARYSPTYLIFLRKQKIASEILDAPPLAGLSLKVPRKQWVDVLLDSSSLSQMIVQKLPTTTIRSTSKIGSPLRPLPSLVVHCSSDSHLSSRVAQLFAKGNSTLINSTAAARIATPGHASLAAAYQIHFVWTALEFPTPSILRYRRLQFIPINCTVPAGEGRISTIV